MHRFLRTVGYVHESEGGSHLSCGPPVRPPFYNFNSLFLLGPPLFSIKVFYFFPCGTSRSGALNTIAHMGPSTHQMLDPKRSSRWMLSE